MADGEKCSEALDLLQPEILSKETLIGYLKKRQVNIKDPESLTKDALIELFHKNVVPQPQRKYRSNRRGQQMARNQLSIEKRKRKFSQTSDGNDGSYKIGQSSANTSATNSRFLTSFNLPPSGDRLKPPPSAINFERKTIKLGGSKNSDSSTAQGINIKTVNTQPLTKITTDVKDAPAKTGVIRLKSSTQTDAKKLETASNESKDSMGKKVPKEPVPTKKVKLNRAVNDVAQKCVLSPQAESKPTETKMDTNGSAKEDTGKTTPESLDSESEKSSLVKKFKRVAVKWP